jgi:UDP-N-acetylglucosamine diphosphorylase / glucose-1-phosphate thymidylyltransferase / UDP-N-acetylgalactosamine diphosphorylase / glucosamine-1-phosphate N-acetyltransferase / galactosamine-1-phosphate N-acetyltransferase
MQAVILAAGISSRFYPYNLEHKSLLKIAGEPIIVHTLRSIKTAGINEVIIVVGKDNLFEPVLGDGTKYGVKIRYVILEEPLGMGAALLKATPFLDSEFFLLHGHHFDFFELKKELDSKINNGENVVLLAKESDSVSAFGVLKLENDNVLEVKEKPSKGEESSRYRIVGIYYLNSDFITSLKSVKSEHYSFESALNEYAKRGKVKAVITKKDLITLKYPWDLLNLKTLLIKNLKPNISNFAKISKSAKITGNVVIEDGSEISENAIIKGPAYIGKNVYIGTNVLIRNESDIEEGVKIGANMEIKNSLIMDKTTTHSGFIGDSVVGLNCKIGSSFDTANVRLDRSTVKTVIKEEKIDTGIKSLGTMIGSHVIVGGRVSIMPGVIVGNNVNIGPSSSVMKNIPSDTVFYTEFKEVVEKQKPIED